MADTILFAALLLVLAVVAAGVCRKLPLPDSVVLVLVGMGLAEIARYWPPAAPMTELAIGPGLVFFVLLPALVFESGLNLDARRLLKNLAPVIALAVPALVLSTAVIGLGLWLVAGLDPTVALLFGALISATDPVAVVALFKEMGAPARLTVLVEGESLFNDATAIVVFGLLLGFALEGGLPGGGALVRALPGLLWVFLGGAVLGVAVACVASELAHRLHSPTPATLAMSVAAAYTSYIRRACAARVRRDGRGGCFHHLRGARHHAPGRTGA
jgi:CPA1 family monovalent cation:H+ antiporter